MTQFQVKATALNLRSSKGVAAENRLATLPQGARVEKLADAGDGWWRVRTTLSGTTVEGFVSAEHLVEIATGPAAAADTANAIGDARTPIHLEEGRRDVTRAREGGRAFPIGEAGHPPALAGDPAARQAGLLAIIDWLDVERGLRWKPDEQTYCNIYAYDVCYLSGVFLPRVWWTGKALARLAQGERLAPLYGKTVGELNANALTEWFEDHGADFGWQRSFDLDALQDTANAGRLAIISAQHRNANSSGHIQVVAPEHAALAARRAAGKITAPLQTQAGRQNIRYGFLGNGAWWQGSQFRKHGFWMQGA